MSHHHIQNLLSRFLSVPRNFRHVQDQRGNHFGFSPFDSDQLRQAQILSDNYFRISRENVSDDPVAKVMAQAQQDAEQYDPELVRYALMVWTVHDPEARKRNLKIPPLGQRAPHIAVPKLVNAAVGAPTLSTTDPPLTNLDWWREDPQLNEHHEHWHIVFPAFPVNGVSKDREGENFAFMHRQMLARYDAERIAVGLQPVKALSDFSERIPEAYNPDSDLVYDPNNAQNVTNVHFIPRSAGKQLTDLAGNGPKISTLVNYRQQLYDGIEGKGQVTFGQDDKSANRLGNILETTLHNAGHVMLAYIMTPQGTNSQNTPPGVMIDTRTASRDPVFWRWHRHVDEVYSRWQNKQAPYDFSDAPPVVIKSNDIILAWKDKLLDADKNGNADGWFSYAQKAFGGANFDADVSSNSVVTNELQTEMKTRNFVWLEDDNNTQVVNYLYPREYFYFFRVQNTTNKNLDITLRVFLAPEEFINSRVHWIELDKIKQTLKPNEKAVFSQNCDESVVIRKPAQKTPEQMDTTAITIEKRFEAESLGREQKSEVYFCDCGWPFNLLLPRGTKQGLKCKLFVMITDGVKDIVKPKRSNAAPKKCGSLSFCGAQQWDELYPDARRMGYPFDKPFKNDSFEQTFAGLKNVAVRDVTIKWVDNFPEV
ncbi:16503_t:CDS:2 [Dentiscutata erythropus]|uniref:16503_t:CDS:1 n=1 Tax=Dentiscutata erythropus TaxID=1348616 RepID=A0A9N9FU08_9GLOM|nr:16503_t:CDS:2 [Dentiscutata erythropus]